MLLSKTGFAFCSSTRSQFVVCIMFCSQLQIEVCGGFVRACIFHTSTSSPNDHLEGRTRNSKLKKLETWRGNIQRVQNTTKCPRKTRTTIYYNRSREIVQSCLRSSWSGCALCTLELNTHTNIDLEIALGNMLTGNEPLV